MSSGFAIEIVRQGWIGPTLEEARTDLCSHGDVRLRMADRVIVSGDYDDEYGYTISTSALMLLRTLESDHSLGSDYQLLLHCGGILMLSCPIGVDWAVSHNAGKVRLSDVVKRDEIDESPAVRFPGLAIELPEDDYRRQIVSFAEAAKQLFLRVEKAFYEDWERSEYETFWEEYDARLSKASR